MKNIFGNKAVSSVNVIKGDDGPTSFFIVGRNNSKQTIKQKIQKFLYNVRKKEDSQIVKSKSTFYGTGSRLYRN